MSEETKLNERTYTAIEVAQYVEAMFNCDGPRKTILFINIWRELFNNKQPFDLRSDLKEKYNEAIDNCWLALVRIETSQRNERVDGCAILLREAFKVLIPEYLK